MSLPAVSWDDFKAAIDANPRRNTTLVHGAASASLAAMPEEPTLEWLPGWTTDSCTVTDAVSLSLWVRDPLYRTAAAPVRKAMEMEEASTLLHEIDGAWKIHKTRGWVRKHLEEDLRMRSAGGEASSDWENVRTQRRAAFLVDYIATVRSLRFGLWWPDHKAVTIIPLSVSDSTDSVQIDCMSAHILMGQNGFRIRNAVWPDLVRSSACTWVLPACAPLIGTNTVAQIREKLATVIPDAGSVVASRQNLWNTLLMETLFKEMK